MLYPGTLSQSGICYILGPYLNLVYVISWDLISIWYMLYPGTLSQSGICYILGPYLNLVYVIDMLPNSDFDLTSPSEGIGGRSEVEDFRGIAVTYLQYLRLTVIVEFLDYAVAMNSTYFAIQRKTKYVYAVSLTLAVAHILANYLFVSVFGLGVEGLGVAAITGRFVALAVSFGICLINVKVGSFPWKGFRKKILIGWKSMMKLGLPGAIFFFIYLSLYEVSTFCSQFINRDTLSTVIILLQILFVMWSINIAMSLATSNLMGKALAEGSIADVKLCIKLTMTNSFVVAVTMGLVAYFLRNYLVGIFTDDPGVIALFCSTFWLPCASLVLAQWDANLNHGVLIAFGAQGFSAMTMTISSLVIGLPFVLVTIFFTDLGLLGILLGWTLCYLVLITTAAAKIWRTDLGEEIEKTQQRVAQSTRGTTDQTEETNLADSKGTRSGEADSGWDSLSESMELLRSSAEFAGTDREVRTVLILFLISTAVFATLATVSFLRDYS